MPKPEKPRNSLSERLGLPPPSSADVVRLHRDGKEVKKAAVLIDDWKLPIFSRRLVAAGYHYDQGPGLTPGTMALYVHTENLQALGQVVLAANKEAARKGAPR